MKIRNKIAQKELFNDYWTFMATAAAAAECLRSLTSAQLSLISTPRAS
jgi:hypothetical protein